MIDAHLFSAGIATERLKDALNELYVTVLVNNVGGSGSVTLSWRTFHERSATDIDTFINFSLPFATHVTRAFLPTMLRNSPSLILNIGNFTGDLPSA